MRRVGLAIALLLAFAFGQSVHLTLPTSMRNPRLLDLFVGTPLEAAYRASVVKSYQSTSCAFASQSTCTATLSTAVATTAALVVPSGVNLTANGGSTLVNAWAMSYVLASSTQVTLSEDLGNVSGGVYFSVVELYPSVLTANGVQRGVITIGTTSTSATASITSVNTAKASVWGCGFRTTRTTDSSGLEASPAVILSNSTTVQASRGAQDGNGSIEACFQVPEFK